MDYIPTFADVELLLHILPPKKGDKISISYSMIHSKTWGEESDKENGWIDYLFNLFSIKDYEFNFLQDKISPELFEYLKTLYKSTSAIRTGHEWEKQIQDGDASTEMNALVIEQCKNGIWQVRGEKQIKDNYYLIGYADCIVYNSIKDLKTTKNYKFGKFLNHPQKDIYMWLFNCDWFDYIIAETTNGAELKGNYTIESYCNKNIGESIVLSYIGNLSPIEKRIIESRKKFFVIKNNAL